MVDKIIEELVGIKSDIISTNEVLSLVTRTRNTALEEAIEIVKKYENDGWVNVKDNIFPKEYLCKDGEYDPSRYVLCQLDNGDIIQSRYWNHRHCKDTIIEQPWLDLETWHIVVAWREKPQQYKGE